MAHQKFGKLRIINNQQWFVHILASLYSVIMLVLIRWCQCATCTLQGHTGQEIYGKTKF